MKTLALMALEYFHKEGLYVSVNNINGITQYK